MARALDIGELLGARPAPPAWAISGLLGVGGRAEEEHVTAMRPPRGTRRPAVHARGSHSIEKRAVHASVLRQDGLPPELFVNLCHRDSRLRQAATRRYLNIAVNVWPLMNTNLFIFISFCQCSLVAISLCILRISADHGHMNHRHRLLADGALERGRDL